MSDENPISDLATFSELESLLYLTKFDAPVNFSEIKFDFAKAIDDRYTDQPQSQLKQNNKKRKSKRK